MGTPKKIVTLLCFILLFTISTVGLSFDKILVPPMLKGNVNAFPNPYAKKSFAAEKKISSLVILSIFLA